MQGKKLSLHSCFFGYIYCIYSSVARLLYVLSFVLSPGLQATWAPLTLAPCQTWQLRTALVVAQVEV